MSTAQSPLRAIARERSLFRPAFGFGFIAAVGTGGYTQFVCFGASMENGNRYLAVILAHLRGLPMQNRVANLEI